MGTPGTAVRRRVQVIGHRGSRRPAVPDWENTVAAVEHALAAGADGVEVDVRRSADSRLVLRHDPHLPDGRPVGAVLAADTGCPEIGRVVACLPRFPGARLIVEVKNTPGEPDFDSPAEASAALLAPLLRQAAAAGAAVLASSFNWLTLEALRDAGVATGFLVPPGVAIAAALAYAREAGHRELHLPVASVLADPTAVRAARDAGLGVLCWTVSATLPESQARSQLDELLASGVDGIICDDPVAVRSAIGA